MSPVETPSNVVSILVYCVEDDSLLLYVDSASGDLFLPNIKSDTNISSVRSATKEAQEILGVKTPVDIGILRIYKIWYPRAEGSTTLWHFVFRMQVDINNKNKTKNSMGKYRGKIRWVMDQEIVTLLTSNALKTPEIIELYRLARNGKGAGDFKIELPDDVIVNSQICEITDEALVSGKNTGNQQLVESSGIDTLAQEDIFRLLFMNQCFPAIYMNLKAFSKIIPDLGWSKPQLLFLFRSADINNRAALSFREFLYFLAAVDPNTAHGGTAAEIRCKYMFKYYDRDRDNLLKADELKYMISDLRRSRKQPIDPAAVAKEAQETYKAMGIEETVPINVNDFLRAVCDLKIRGTSHIYRSTTSVLKYLKDQQIGAPVGSSPAGRMSQSLRYIPQLENPRGILTMKNVDYEVAVHVVRIQKSGEAINIDQLREVTEAVSLSTLKQPTNEHTKKISLDLFSQRSVVNELLRGLRYLVSINNTKELSKTSYTWGQLDPLTYGRNLIQICTQVREIFKNEPRLLHVSSPVYILGDFHGNIADLLYFEKTLWHIGPGLCPSNLLFLGDYVDRGPFSIEVISYLFAYKLQSPRKVSLLRGNHEIREVQKMFTFYKECCLKLGDKLGQEVWNAVNNAFDTMPIAATVDEKLFCCHGGAPPPWLCPVISAINDIPNVLNQPDSQSSLAWEIMWNDPVRTKTVNDKLAMELLANEGFAVNTRRGTAHIFSVEALERFLKANQLTHLIRAHEVVQAGFQVQQKGKLLTVFSSSKYCGGNNDAACVMADQGKLRILRLDTK